VFDLSMGSPYCHYRDVDWLAKDIPRDRFDQDILYSLGAFMTVCRINKNNAFEDRRLENSNVSLLMVASHPLFHKLLIEIRNSTLMAHSLYDSTAKRPSFSHST